MTVFTVLLEIPAALSWKLMGSSTLLTTARLFRGSLRPTPCRLCGFLVLAVCHPETTQKASKPAFAPCSLHSDPWAQRAAGLGILRPHGGN